MPTPPLTDADLDEAVAALEACAGNKTEAAATLRLPRGTFCHRLALAQSRPPRPPEPVLPHIPDDDISVEELIDQQCRRFEKRHSHQAAKKWAAITMPDDRPFGVAWIGDPHVDDNGCNWPLLKRHCELLASTEGCYAANVGDTENRWVGRLMALWAEQDTSQGSAWKLAKWLLEESGVHWLVWVLGNHDLWREGAALWREANRPQRVLLAEWGAQFKLVSPGAEFKIWMSHDFPGRSIYNSLHGPQRAAHMKEEADLYVAGHTHNWALHQEESASKGFTYWLARARGYKWIDSHAERLGHQSQQEGASILSVFDPKAVSLAGRVQCFADLEVGCDYLQWLRAKSG